MEELSNDEFVYVICDEQGVIRGHDNQKVFYVKSESKIKVILPPGALDCHTASLIMNLPYEADNDAFYTMAEPMISGTNEDSKVEEIVNKYGNEYDNYYAEFIPEQNKIGTMYFEVHLMYPGVFFFQFKYNGNQYTKPQYIQVDPEITIKGESCNINSLRILTVLSRSLGKLDRWQEFITRQQKLGYNAIHLTPIQTYGKSFSHYSLANQIDIDDWYFDEDEQLTSEEKYDKLKYTINNLQIETGMLFFIDIVLNHTAGNSEWIKEHHDATYNTDNWPHLNVAYVLDKAITDFDIEINKTMTIENDIKTHEDVEEIMKEIEFNVIKKLRLFEFFQLDQDLLPPEYKIASMIDTIDKTQHIDEHFDLNHYVYTHAYGQGEKRFGVKIDLEKLLTHVVLKHPDLTSKQYLNKLNALYVEHNIQGKNEACGYIQEAINAIRGEIIYKKLQMPAYERVKPGKRMLTSYFRVLDNPQKTKCVHNGWSMAGDASKQDFCRKDGWFYFRRYIIAWGDSVKLRYGDWPNDSPYLWKHMTQYVKSMALIFDGVRLDNAHSTPKHIAKYMLQTMRSANLSSYVLAEFFTPSRESEAEATRELGINGLIREMQNYGNCKDLSTQCHGYGGCQEYIIGKLDDYFLDNSKGTMYRRIQQRYPLPVFYDMTHDNRSTIEKYPPGNIALPHLVLNSSLWCGISSTYGFDIMLPINLSVVKEKRKYAILDEVAYPANVYEKYWIETYEPNASYIDVCGDFNDWNPQRMNTDKHGYWTHEIEMIGHVQFKFIVDGEWKTDPKIPIDKNTGNNLLKFEHPSETVYTDLRYIRHVMSQVHQDCNEQDASIFLHHDAPNDVIQIVRRLENNPKETYDGYNVIARCNFHSISNSKVDCTYDLPGKFVNVVLCANLSIEKTDIESYVETNEENEIIGLNTSCIIHHGIERFWKIINHETYDSLKFHRMPEGFVLVAKTITDKGWLEKQKFVDDFVHNMYEIPEFKKLDLSTVNYCLYKWNEEELDSTDNKRGVFSIDGVPIKYAGIGSLMHIIRFLKRSQDLGHPLFNNIRHGNWLMDYIVTRFKENKNTEFIGENLDAIFSVIKTMDNSSKPKYFAKTICYLWDAIMKGQLKKLSKKQLRWYSQDDFLMHLLEASSQFYGDVKSVRFDKYKDSLWAGLPHFATNCMRCWGRDTFIAFRGLLLATGNYKEARDTLIYYAEVSRHGLIPNLHDTGHNARFNARDATWFFLQAIKEYVNHTDEGVAFLFTEVNLVFHSDDQEEHLKVVEEGRPLRKITIGNLIQEILTKHASGIEFREWNAGTKIDEQMSDKGFDVKIKLDPMTGFIYGGSSHNCGTWMDKMGSAESNKGVPASPRDGAAIEITGLWYSIVSWLKKLYDQGVFEHSGVNIDADSHYSYESWMETLQYSFERWYYIPSDSAEDFEYGCKTDLVNERGIYKDLFNSSEEWRCYQFRPNQVIAMSVAPQLFSKNLAQVALENISDKLIVKNKSLGIKTLSPSDWNYKPNYDNNDETHGWNYHNGPEWVWPMGYFLKARLIFFGKENHQIMKYLVPHQKHIYNDPWMSLPELTQS